MDYRAGAGAAAAILTSWSQFGPAPQQRATEGLVEVNCIVLAHKEKGQAVHFPVQYRGIGLLANIHRESGSRNRVLS